MGQGKFELKKNMKKGTAVKSRTVYYWILAPDMTVLNLIIVIIPDFHPGLPATLGSLAKAVAS